MKSFFKEIITYILILEAKLVLKKYKPKIIAITGSVGKTSTKDAIYSVLKHQKNTRKSEKSFNSEIGIPLTILGLKNAWLNPIKWLQNIIDGLSIILFKTNYPEVLILEVGADRPGDIEKVSKWLKPDVAVFTAMGETPVHVEYFKNADEVFKEKSFLVKALKPNGTLIYTEDDPRSPDMRALTKTERFSFGFVGGADFKASHSEIFYDGKADPSGMRFRIDNSGNSVPVTINGVIGKQHIYPVLAAAAVAHVFNMNLINLSQYMEDHVAAPGRMNLIPGIKDSIIIDDTYNASPIAVLEALETLGQIKDKNGEQKKIAVLGDMMELGSHSSQEHYDVGLKAAKVTDVLVTVGVRARKIAEGALAGGFSEKKIYQFENSQIAGKFLEGIVDPHDVVLIKGSQSPRMERAVHEIMAEPEKATDLLVRQGAEWSKR